MTSAGCRVVRMQLTVPLRNREGALRAGLLAIALPQALLGIWASIPPFFYTDFPTAGTRWIARLGLYNPHLSFDFGVSALALSVVLLAAGVLLRRELAVVALVAWLVWSIPHLVYHVATADELSTAENLVNLGGLAIAVALPLGLLALVSSLWGDRGPAG